MDEAIDDARADEMGQRTFGVAAPGNHQHQIGKLTFDLRHENAGILGQREDVQHQDAHLAGQEQIANLVSGRNVPYPARVPHGLPQRLQKRFVGAEHHQLDDFAGEAEVQRILIIVLVFRG